ncbi:MAG TPA: lectin-like protein [Kofleriaceae bacterium]|jgi:hypothetical protein|nr:lectin-like protein [Kofleriaceae bacterium]
MRVLSLLAVVLAGCYDPGIRDCQFTCPDNRCPGDLACMAGVCRTAGASGSCPCPDPPSGCTLASNSSGLCLATCSAATDWNAANAACTAAPPWQLAVLDTSSTLSAGENALRTATTWVGLTRSAVNVFDWHWVSGGGTVAATASDWTSDMAHSGSALTNLCAALDRGKLYSDECDVTHAYACTMN